VRRTYWLGGALLGVVVGGLIAFFVIPPLFDRYFSTADIALGQTYRRGDGLAIRALPAREVTGAGEARIEVGLEVGGTAKWCPEPRHFRLELEGGVSLAGARFEPPPPCPDGGMGPGLLAITFAAGNHEAGEARTLHVAEPKARFWLQPGEPGE
jgi:hypothetical protein